MAPTTQRSDRFSEPIGPQDTAGPLAAPEHAPTYQEVLHATRVWVLYGAGGFAVLCILIGAVEGLFGR